MIIKEHDFKQLASIDLNLLLVFRVLDETRHVTEASKILGVTQPALSHALGRLRDLFHDPLFVKSSNGMVPTPLAESIRTPLKEILEKLESTVLKKETFNPATLERTFRLKTTDLVDGLMMPKLIQKLSEEAPKVKVSVLLTGKVLPKEELETGQCDLAVAGFYGDLPDGFYQRLQLSDSFRSAVRKDHPRIRTGKISIDQFCNEKHILIAPGGELTGIVDKALKVQKKKRHVIAGVSSFMVSGFITAQSDCVLTAPTRLLQQFENYLPLRVFETPLELNEIKIYQVWHHRTHEDPACKWFRDLIHSILK